MPVYFVSDDLRNQVKIGRSTDVKRRVKTLQTGNPSALKLMGWINTANDASMESELHEHYKGLRGIGEWFSIGPTEVLNELKRHYGFVPKPTDSFEIIGFDRDGIPEYLGVCEWGDFEIYECCPFCGCFCGMHFQDASSMHHCINCDTLINFDELHPPQDWNE
ncbi:GIY-YIG nuclease family protein [Iodobacter fluviatilis]|uniref:Meiotically Up-regulated Gene 113 (MUG113) protein n=1 Tax=Iodobacter fluviatilis TaxID=537 RepID=A0A377Q3M8_9NEIS|nr:GIY-YIG nuclease family protein [Iodobacter fluviatilis]TCU90283.1 Meiotically Up-regulated Gene 113 (MUG113) protein [Iodobacter fluviatilis]STQ89310.1 T5orf172 domain [Iodobacter fluviatilis]